MTTTLLAKFKSAGFDVSFKETFDPTGSFPSDSYYARPGFIFKGIGFRLHVVEAIFVKHLVEIGKPWDERSTIDPDAGTIHACTLGLMVTAISPEYHLVHVGTWDEDVSSFHFA